MAVFFLFFGFSPPPPGGGGGESCSTTHVHISLLYFATDGTDNFNYVLLAIILSMCSLFSCAHCTADIHQEMFSAVIYLWTLTVIILKVI